MKTNKKLIICALLLITMISIVGAVSASESSNDTLSTTDTANDVASIDDSQSLSESTTTTSSSNNDNTETPDSETQNIDKTITPTVGNANDQTTVKAKRKVNTTNIENFFNATTGYLTDNVADGDELEFEGEFKNKALGIDKKVSLIGKNAIMNNTAFFIAANNVKISNFTFIADNKFEYGTIITDTANDTIIENNNITYTTSTNESSYAIYALNVVNLKIINNTINYTGNTNGTVFNNAIRVDGDEDGETPSTNILVEKNKFNIKIPSIDVIYDSATWEPTIYSEGIVFYYCNKIKFSENTVNITYNDISGYFDTIYGISFRGNPYNFATEDPIICNNISIKNNNITAKGHGYIYGIYTSANLFEITNNILNVSSDYYYANGIDIDGPAENGTVSENEIIVSSPEAAYGIYSYQSNGKIDNITYNNNNITTNAYASCGIELRNYNPTITKNTITSNGNYTYGIVIGINENGTIQENTIKALGNNKGTKPTGDSLLPLNSMGISIKGNSEIKENTINSTHTGINIVKDSEATITNNNITANITGIKSDKANINVLNNNITTMGNYTIQVKDSTAYIKNNNLTANTTTGDKTIENDGSIIKDIVTPETFKDFFDDEGYIKTINNYLTFIGLFDGADDNIGLNAINLNETTTIIGNNAIFKNIGLIISGDNVNISNITFIADKIFDKKFAVIYSEGENTTIDNNTITYTAPSTADSYAIYLESADGSQITNNIIDYEGKINNTNNTITIAIYSTYSDNLHIKNNKINATIPSQNWVDNMASSAAILLTGGENNIIEDNNITANYKNSKGYFDSLYAIKASLTEDLKINKNNVTINGHTYTYIISVDNSKNTEITNNNLLGNSDDHLVDGIEIGDYFGIGATTLTITNNNITTNAKEIIYPITISDYVSYDADWNPTPAYEIESTITNNNINGNANTAYGIYTQEKSTNINKNNRTRNGNYTTGIMTYQTKATITNNNINSNGTNTGKQLDKQSGAPENETVGICSSLGAIEVTNNNITSTGNYTIHIMDTDGTIKDNNLTANGTTGANTVKNEGSIITDIVTPANIGEFFDNNGMLIETVSNKLIFQGLFNGTKYHIYPKALKITQPITIIGNNAIFQNLGLTILEDNVTVSNITFIADTNLNELIYIFGENTIIKNNTITYNAPSTADSYAIYLESADGSQLIGNKINYTGKLNSTYNTITIPIYAEYSANILLKDNTINATIPASGIVWSQDPVTGDWFPDTLLSSGIITKNSANTTIQNNNITIKYNETDGWGYDTIYAININGNGTAKLTGNNIEITGNAYVYGIATTDFENVEITNNNIKTIAEADQSNALELVGNSTFNIEGNNITSIAKDIVYPIHLSNTDKATSDVTINKNNITGEADVVYGIYTQGHDNTISNNNIEAKGKYTTGIMNHKSDATIINNNINSNGTNTGSAKYFQGGAPVNETLAICSSLSTVEIINNNLTSTGNYTLNATKCKVILGTESETFNLLNEDVVLKEIAADKTQISNLTEQVGTLTNQTENLTKQVGTLTDENKKLTTEKDDANKALAAKNTEAANLQTQVGSLTAENKQLNSDLKTANNKVSDSNASIKKVKAASSVKKSKNFKVTVTLNKKVKGKYVYVAFNGNTYRAKTNSKGVATITIKSKVIKKLAGKKVKYQVMFGQKMYKKSVKVKK